MKYYLEICAATPHSVDAAYTGGADRIELCSGLEMGGLTPSKGLLDFALSKNTLPVHVLIRPRPGNFVYSDQEMNIILNDIAWCRENRAAGIVCGALTFDGHYNLAAIKAMIECCAPLPFTFHRGVDYSVDGPDALESLISCGVKRILTSGGQASALAGAQVIRDVVRRFGSRLEIMAGGGIDDENITDVVKLTGVNHIHMSAKAMVVSANDNSAVSTGSSAKTRGHFESQVQIVRASRKALDIETGKSFLT